MCLLNEISDNLVGTVGNQPNKAPAHRHPVVRIAETRRYDCEDRLCSLMVMGCGLATAGVTPGMTGFRAFVRHVRSWSPAPARSEELA